MRKWKECYIPKEGEFLGIKLKVKNRDLAEKFILKLGKTMFKDPEELWNGFEIKSIDYFFNRDDISELKNIKNQMNTLLDSIIDRKTLEDEELNVKNLR